MADAHPAARVRARAVRVRRLSFEFSPAVPADTLFGVWVHTSGFAVSLVILSFAGAWGFPIIAGVIGGDMFSSEDRLGTWKTMLTRSCTREEIFLGKAATAFAYTLATVVLLGAASIVAGVVATGAHPLVGLTGQTLGSGHAAALTVAAWGISLVPAVGFTALALLISAVTRSSAAGMLGPLVAALAMQLFGLLGSGDVVRALLLSTALDAWNGMFAAPSYTRPMEWAGADCPLLRDWLPDGRLAERSQPRHRRSRVRGAQLGSSAPGTRHRRRGHRGAGGGQQRRADVGHRGQAQPLDRARVREPDRLAADGPRSSRSRRLHTSTTRRICSRQGVRHPYRGPGDTGAATIYVPTLPKEPIEVSYDVTVKPNGCYTAAGPESFIGPLTIHRPNGQRDPQPAVPLQRLLRSRALTPLPPVCGRPPTI